MEGFRAPDRAEPAAALELPIRGMDCAGCTKKVQKSLCALPGVRSAEVLLASEKAVVQFDPQRVSPGDLRRAVEGAGYRVPVEEAAPASTAGSDLSRSVLRTFGIVFGAVVAVVVPRPGATLDPGALAGAMADRIARFKQPRRIVVADELPRNAMGKVQKAALRETHRAMFA